MADSTADRLRLIRSEGVGPVTYRRLLARYGSAAAALDALPQLARAGGRAAAPIIPPAADITRELAAIDRIGATLLLLDTPGYPDLLAELPDAPPALLVLGDVACLNARAVAIVGSRNASANGQRLAETIAGALAQAGIAVVSGLARGIDTAAHRGALAQGRTIAGSMCPTPRKTPRCKPPSPATAPWSPKPLWAPPRSPATFRAATG